MRVRFPFYHTNFNKPKVDWRIKKLLNLINKCNTRNLRILDVGCSSTPLLIKMNESLRSEKYNIEFVGIDYNELVVESLQANNICAYNLDISDLSPEDIKRLGKFDIIWMSHVLEHLNVNQQIKAMENISQLSKTGTYLFIFAPTPYHWYFWDDFTHIRPLTHGSIQDLIENFGFKTLEARYSLLRIFPDNLQRWLRLPPLRFFLWEVYVIATYSPSR